MINAVKKLKECGNPFYQDVEVDENFMNKVHPVDQAEEEAKQQEGGFADQIDNSEQIDDDEESNNPVKKFQSKQDSNTCLTPMNLDNKVITNNSSKTIKKRSGEGNKYIEIAPGENKIPLTGLRKEYSDVKAFPKHHPSGLNGRSHPRKYKLTNQSYFIQRLFNKDERFAKDNFYLFMAATHVEQESLENCINISGNFNCLTLAILYNNNDTYLICRTKRWLINKQSG